ncbi:DNA adenine methylase [Gleimia hominis]|uniref:site-specific DNA-methyltransferase (adenine-specific) n=1 Tax=Gleimia hominis TaxID=595468 RepID=A0ABU3IBW1_9ACTO|nr:DNA adenine methylase [Gleimia hominis]MDT3767867.1 DNA adenine methylase [Gleimia hominis]
MLAAQARQVQANEKFVTYGRADLFKYLGSKRRLVPALAQIAQTLGAETAVDLFTGTTRVAQAFKKLGIHTTACDIATYSHVLAQTYVQTDARSLDMRALEKAVEQLNALEGKDGYVTDTFCKKARYFQPKNGRRIDAIRDQIEHRYAGTELYPILLTSLMEAADRVDSTTGVQMAYLKQWAARAYRDMHLRIPHLLPGGGRAVRGDAMRLVDELEPVDLMYLDPPYNQHRYFTNYHIWETLVRWDAPQTYGVAMKRVDAREDATKSVFNSKPRMKRAFFDLLGRARARTLVVSYNDESWIEADEMRTHLKNVGFEDVAMLAFDYNRYVGAKIGIHSPTGKRVGKVSHTRCKEWVFVAGPRQQVQRIRGLKGIVPAGAPHP